MRKLPPLRHELCRHIIDGIWYDAYDAKEQGGQLVYADPPVPWATMRVFVDEHGIQHVYRFETEEDRFTDFGTLERQVRTVFYLAGTGRHPADLAEESAVRMRESLEQTAAEHVRAAARVNAYLAANPRTGRR